MRAAVVACLLAGCGRIAFDPTSGDGGATCTDPPATRTIHAGDDLYGLLATLGPGEVIEVEAGTYTSPGNAPMTWSGTEAAPIIVRAAPGARPVLVNTPGNNGLDLAGAYFTLRGFELTGGDMGVRFDAADHATLDELYIHDVVDEGVTCNHTGKSCNALMLRRLEIVRTSATGTGNGITLGCSDGTCTVTASIVEGCYIHDLNGTAGAGVSVWEHAGTTVRDNVLARTAGPGIVLQESSSGARDVVERNLVWSVQDNGIQIEGQVIVRNNIVVAPRIDGIESRLEATTPPTNLEIVHNTVVDATSACLRGADWASGTQIAANNALYCSAGTALVVSGNPTLAGNIALGIAPTGTATGTSVAADLGTPPNVYPPAGSALVDTGDPAHAVADDFNGTPRTGAPDVGAYERTSAANPGWIPGDSEKPIATCP